MRRREWEREKKKREWGRENKEERDEMRETIRKRKRDCLTKNK